MKRLGRLNELMRKWPRAKLYLTLAAVTGVVIGVAIASNVSSGETRARQEEVGDAVGEMPAEERKAKSNIDRIVEKLEENKEKESREERVADKKLIALTFDDGPGAETTERLLDVLKEKDVRATFFPLGMLAERRPEVLKRAVEEGNEVANHTLNHKNFSKIDGEAIEWEIRRSKEIIEAATGVGVKYVRPPYGIVNETVQKEGVTVLWSVDPKDWKDKDAGIVRERAVSAAHDGAIVLMHDIYWSTVDAVGGIIDDLRGQGYEFVTVSELFELKGWTPETGGVYKKIGD